MSQIQHMPSHNRLMLVHGLIDENVHFRHTARLINALIGQRKRYDLVLFPCERHAPHKHEGGLITLTLYSPKLIRAPFQS